MPDNDTLLQLKRRHKTRLCIAEVQTSQDSHHLSRVAPRPATSTNDGCQKMPIAEMRNDSHVWNVT